MKRLLTGLLLLGLVGSAPAQQGDVKAGLEHALSQTLLVVRVGDYHTGGQGLEQFRKYANSPDLPARGEMFYGPEAIVPLAISWGQGQYDEVVREGQRRAELAKAAHHPERELSLLLLVVDALESSGHSGQVRNHLPRLRELAAHIPGARGTLDRFLVESAAARDDFQRHHPSHEELLARVEKTFALLQGFKIDDDFESRELLEVTLAQDAVNVWMTFLIRFDLPHNNLNLALDTYGRLLHPLVETRRKIDSSEQGFFDKLGLFMQIEVFRARVILHTTGTAYRAGYLDEKQTRGVLEPLLANDQKLLDDVPDETAVTHAVRQGGLGLAVALFHDELANVVLTRLRPRPGSASADDLQFLQLHLPPALELIRKSSDAAAVIRIQEHWLEALWLGRPSGWQEELDQSLGRIIPLYQKASQRMALIDLQALLGKLRAEQKRIPEAIAALTQAITGLEESIQEFASPELSARVREIWHAEYDLLARLQIESGQSQDAMATLDRRAQLATAVNLPLRDLHPVKATLRSQVAEAAALQTRMQETRNPQLLAQTRSQYYQVIDRLQREEPGYSRLSVRPANFSRVQANLPGDTVLVQIFPAEDHLYLFVATHDSLKIRKVELKRTALEASVRKFRRSALAQESGQEAALELGEALLTPLQEDLAGKSVVAFVPTGLLHYFPLQALARKGSDGTPHFLIQDHPVVVLAKASDLDVLSRPAAKGGPLVALADPDGSLPGARQEAAALQPMFAGSQVWVGAQATAERLRTLVANTSYLHLATHGTLATDDPTNSYLLLAGSPNHLRVADIAGLDLSRLRLVTLSACQTALADRNPEQGWDLASLADAFGFAGSPSLLASLWKVDDAATRDLMVEFYRALSQGKSRAVALQQAQLKLLAQPATRNPFFWAGFVLIGDWR